MTCFELVRLQEKEWTVKEATPGESIYSLLSFINCISGRPEKLRTVSAKAQCDTTLVRMPFSAFTPVFEKYPETLIRVVQVSSLSCNEFLFRSRKKISTHAIVFFSPDLFMKISNFSKTVRTIFIKFCTVILHLKGPLRAQRHQNRKTGM